MCYHENLYREQEIAGVTQTRKGHAIGIMLINKLSAALGNSFCCVE